MNIDRTKHHGDESFAGVDWFRYFNGTSRSAKYQEVVSRVAMVVLDVPRSFDVPGCLLKSHIPHRLPLAHVSQTHIHTGFSLF